MVKLLISFSLLICAFFCTAEPAGASEPGWFRYSVVLPYTGTATGDRRQIFNFRQRLARVSFSFLGLPYDFGGNGPRSYDCSGFIKAVYRQMGIQLPRTAVEQGTAGCPIRLDLSALETGDLIYFHSQRRGWPHHVAMYLWDGWFIHATSGKGVIIENFRQSKLRSSVKSISRIFFTREEVDILNRMYAAGKFGYSPSGKN